jgi:putative restriction endonuclease
MDLRAGHHASDILQQLEAVNIWRRGSQRAPHKPLLLLLTLASVLRGEPRQQPYAEIDENLRCLLTEFGPYRKSIHPEYPFWRLQNDGDFWEIPQRDVLLIDLQDRKRVDDVPPAILRDHQATGGFSQPVYNLLRRDHRLAKEIVARLLQAHFPPSLHEAILDAVGMPLEEVVVLREVRDPAFRDTIIRIYEHRCAICGFDGKLGMSDLALDAAHVMWRAADGPDSEDNGLALCVLHHRLFDRGALGISPDYRILVSQHVHGGDEVLQAVVRFAGSALRTPQPGASPVAARFIEWHYHEVFRQPERWQATQPT